MVESVRVTAVRPTVRLGSPTSRCSLAPLSTPSARAVTITRNCWPGSSPSSWAEGGEVGAVAVPGDHVEPVQLGPGEVLQSGLQHFCVKLKLTGEDQRGPAGGVEHGLAERPAGWRHPAACAAGAVVQARHRVPQHGPECGAAARLAGEGGVRGPVSQRQTGLGQPGQPAAPHRVVAGVAAHVLGEVVLAADDGVGGAEHQPGSGRPRPVLVHRLHPDLVVLD